MAISTKKRKRHEYSSESESISEDEDTLRARFQRAFEAKFRPLERSTQLSRNELMPEIDASDVRSGEESDWEGIPDEEGPVQVVDHEVPQSKSQDQLNRERKAFMSSRPPNLADKAVSISKIDTPTSEDDSMETTNLKHDLALQRLLKESHLLDSNTFDRKVSTPEGKGRLKALDLRLRDLGAKHSISEQENMPLSHRRGISEKRMSREETRQKNASESGVILEKAKLQSKPLKRRAVGIGAPQIGKFRDGTLKLSSRDVTSIVGPKQNGAKGRKGRR